MRRLSKGHGGLWLERTDDNVRWLVNYQKRHRQFGRRVVFVGSRSFRSERAQVAYQATHFQGDYIPRKPKPHDIFG